MENKEIEIFFRTRNSCTVRVPANLKKKQAIREFIIDKIVQGEIDDHVEKWFDFEIEDFKILEEEE